MNKLFLSFIMFLYVNMCLNVCSPPSPTYLRPETLVTHLEMDITSILPLMLICVCLVVHILSHIDLNCRFISFNTRLNTLTVSAKERSHDKLNFYLLFLTYLLIFEYFFVVFLPFEFWKVNLDLQSITKKTVIFVKMCHNSVANTATCA